MADFRTHLVVASSGSALCASAAVSSGLPRSWFLLLAVAGAIGGILPDIDLLRPSRVSRVAFSLTFALLTVFELSETYSISELWVLWCLVFLAAGALFSLLPVPYLKHRGILHSIMAGSFFMTLTAVVFYRVFKEDATLAWSVGLFVFMGFVTHLALDEIYAIDYRTGKVKRSYGSALKLFDSRSLRASGLMACALCSVTLVAPPTKDFAEVVKPPVFFALLKDRLLPKGSWFGLELPKVALPPNPGQSAETLAVTTPSGAVDVKAETSPRQHARSAKQKGCGRKPCGYCREVRRR